MALNVGEHDLASTAWATRTKAHDGTITTEAPDVTWGTDMTPAVTSSAFVFGVDGLHNRGIGLS